MSWIDIGPVGMVDEGEVAAAEALGTPLAIFCKDGRFFALHDLCTYGQARLSEGFVRRWLHRMPAAPGPFRYRDRRASVSARDRGRSPL